MYYTCLYNMYVNTPHPTLLDSAISLLPFVIITYSAGQKFGRIHSVFFIFMTLIPLVSLMCWLANMCDHVSLPDCSHIVKHVTSFDLERFADSQQ